MTIEELLSFQSRAVIPRFSIDWGRGRGQGKRNGAGGVVGAMSDPPRGVKFYKDYRNAEGVTPEIYEEIRVLEATLVEAVIGVIQAGGDADAAITAAFRAS